MPFTEQELQNYQFYLQLEEERDKKCDLKGQHYQVEDYSETDRVISISVKPYKAKKRATLKKNN